MASTPPSPIPPEHRLLAVIVFTDVVSFTSRMQMDEATTLKLLDRDFATMRKLGERLAGTEIKTTGDGLLFYFTSAVRAMAWAVRAQRHFAELARREPADQVLRHRVGLHLGDVYLRADDLMGDGVNIAARLLAEAPPGGICISQTVYDVVKNKLKLHVVRLEPRQLKNIKEAIQMYHVLLDPPRRILPADARTRNGTPAAPAGPRPHSGSRVKKMVAPGLLLFGFALAAVLITKAYFDHEEEMARSQASHAALGAALRAGRGTAAAPGEKDSPAAVEESDFAQMTLAGATATDAAVRPQADAALAVLSGWMDTSLQRYNRERPLRVRSLSDAAVQDYTVHTDSARRLHYARSGATRPRAWQDLKPEEQATLIVSVLLDSPTAPRDVLRGADAFAYVHGLPEMARALLRLRRPAGGASP